VKARKGTFPNVVDFETAPLIVNQCWNWPKRTGGVRCRNVWNFAQGLKFQADFHSKMSGKGASGDMIWGGGGWTPTPRQFQPGWKFN